MERTSTYRETTIFTIYILITEIDALIKELELELDNDTKYVKNEINIIISQVSYFSSIEKNSLPQWCKDISKSFYKTVEELKEYINNDMLSVIKLKALRTKLRKSQIDILSIYPK